MKHYYILVFIILIAGATLAQESEGVIALNFPFRNSLSFNTFAIAPTFSFVKETRTTLALTNNRSWTEFTDAPQTNLISFSGKFDEKTGLGIAAFQQNYGVLTAFGGLVNYAYNIEFGREYNLTFGLNLNYYNSQINKNKIQSYNPEPSVNNFEPNSIFTADGGFNFGNDVYNIGVTITNLVTYNLENAYMIPKNPQKAIQLHTMYTKVINNRSFFDQSQLNVLLRAKVFQDEIEFTSLVMFFIPRGLWTQIGYDTFYGATTGIGINISNTIALEYNFENAIGNKLPFGTTHEITLAYKFRSKLKSEKFKEQESGLFIDKTKIDNISILKAPLSRKAMKAKKEKRKKQLKKKKSEN